MATVTVTPSVDIGFRPGAVPMEAWNGFVHRLGDDHGRSRTDLLEPAPMRNARIYLTSGYQREVLTQKT
jgi:hypothetical protein